MGKDDAANKPKSLLWKYDKILGIAFFCPNCKTFICLGNKCGKCGQVIDWNNTVHYKGKVNWS